MGLWKLISIFLFLVVVHDTFHQAYAPNPEYWDLPDCSAARIKQLLYRVCIMFKRSVSFFVKTRPIDNEKKFMEGTPRQHFTRMLGRYFWTALSDSDEDDLDGPVVQRYPTRYYVPSGSINSTGPLASYFSMNGIRDSNGKMAYYMNKYDDFGNELDLKGGRTRRKRDTDNDENSLVNRVKRQIETLIASCCSPSGCNKMDFIRLEAMYPICNTANDVET